MFGRGEKVPNFPKARPGFFNSFAHAWAGLIHTVVHQRNMKVHMLSAILVSLVGSGIPLGLAEKVTLIFCVLFIFFAEILNSALEALVDLHVKEFDEHARVTKDAAAAGVLVLSVGTVVIFSALLVHNLDTIRTHQSEIIRQVLLGIPLTLCTAVLMRRKLRPIWMDLAWFLTGVGLWAAILLRTESYVFSAMTLGLLTVALNAAFERRRIKEQK
ncbi:MAG: diacylglycerol kinase family protein [Myxococcaceae bacterium]